MVEVAFVQAGSGAEVAALLPRAQVASASAAVAIAAVAPVGKEKNNKSRALRFKRGALIKQRASNISLELTAPQSRRRSSAPR